MIQLFDAYDGSTLRKPAAAQERSLFALSNYQLTLFALMTGNIGWLWGRFWRHDVALLVEFEGGLAVWIVGAAEE